MGYQEALEAAGAEVHSFEYFGSYQGDWYAYVTYQGKTGWIHGYFGSCSYCDAFEGECGYGASEGDLAAFGLRYLDELITQEEAETKASENLEWDLEAKEMLQHIKDNAIQK